MSAPDRYAAADLYRRLLEPFEPTAPFGRPIGRDLLTTLKRWEEEFRPGSKSIAVQLVVGHLLVENGYRDELAPTVRETMLLRAVQWLASVRGRELDRIADATKRGGALTGAKKRAKAEEWQDRLRPKIEKYIRAGRSNANIGRLLAEEDVTLRAISDYAAELRRTKKRPL